MQSYVKHHVTKKSDLEPGWHVVDAEGKTLGRFATEIAVLLMGKHKTNYVPNLNTGDFVVVVNAEKVALTGKKEEQKQYMFYSGYVGNEKYRNVADFRAKRPTFIIENAVKGMMPKNRLAQQMLKKLKIYAGPEHPHEAQNPQPLEMD